MKDIEVTDRPDVIVVEKAVLNEMIATLQSVQPLLAAGAKLAKQVAFFRELVLALGIDDPVTKARAIDQACIGHGIPAPFWGKTNAQIREQLAPTK